MKFPSLKSTRAKAIAALVAIAVVVGGPILFLRAQEAGYPEVQLTKVTRARITNSVVGVADIKARDRSTLTLSPSVKVVDVLVVKGQRVARGDLLAVLDTSDFEAQLAQQGISLADAESTLQHLAGPNASMTTATSQNAVSQAQVALANARATEAAARRALADAPVAGDNTRRQAEIGLEGARVNEDAAQANLDSSRDLNTNAVRQAEIALTGAKDAYDKAARDVTDLKQRLLAGLVTQAQYDAQYPLLVFARTTAENACRSAQVALDSARVTADANVRLAEKAATDAQLAVASAEATLDAADLQADAQLRAAQEAVSGAQRAVSSAEIALSNARSGASFGRASDTERVSNQRSQVALLDANITYLRDKVEQGKLRATVDGVVSRVDAVANQYPQLGDSIVVEGTFGYVAGLDAAQSDSIGVRAGQAATVTLKGIGATYRGSVTAVAPVAEKSATATDQHPLVGIDVAVLDPDDKIRVGFEADVEVLLDDKADALQVGVEAVRSEPGSGRRYVWVVDDRNRVRKVFVQTGIEAGDQVEVLGGLTQGQDCVAQPADSLTDGATVRIAGGRR